MSSPPSAAAGAAHGVLVMHDERALRPPRSPWRAIASPLAASPWIAAVGLADDDVLLRRSVRTAELYDPTATGWTATSGPHTGSGPAVLLANPRTVLIVGMVSSARFDPVPHRVVVRDVSPPTSRATMRLTASMVSRPT